MTIAGIVIITVVVTLAAIGIGFAALKAKQAGLSVPWDKMRPILSDVFVEAQKIIEADKLGYEALENYAVQFVKNQIDQSDFFSASEKALLSAELIRSVIQPRLQELYKKER
jgi:hypothetical protein